MSLYPKFIKYQPVYSGFEMIDLLVFAVLFFTIMLITSNSFYSLIVVIPVVVLRKVLFKFFDVKGIALKLLHGGSKESWLEGIRRIER